MTENINQTNKQLVWNHWRALESSAGAELEDAMHTATSPALSFHGFDPVNDLAGPEAFLNGYWRPLKRSFAGLTRRCHLLIGGSSSGRADGLGDGRMWVGGTGTFDGTFSRDWLGIPATGQPVRIRWAECSRVSDEKIAETYVLLDLVDFLQQCAVQVLPPGRGVDGVYPPPKNDNGVLLDTQNRAESEETLELIRHFIFESLNAYDRQSLESMDVSAYFRPDLQWYGPGGIGHCAGLRAFETLHQRHWLQAFPDRTVQDLDALFAEGAYCCGTGWGGVHATHEGPYLDCPASGRRVVVNGLDFWRRQGNQFIENWVFVDMVHLFRQFGTDLLARASAT